MQIVSKVCWYNNLKNGGQILKNYCFVSIFFLFFLFLFKLKLILFYNRVSNTKIFQIVHPHRVPKRTVWTPLFLNNGLNSITGVLLQW